MAALSVQLTEFCHFVIFDFLSENLLPDPLAALLIPDPAACDPCDPCDPTPFFAFDPWSHIPHYDPKDSSRGSKSSEIKLSQICKYMSVCSATELTKDKVKFKRASVNSLRPTKAARRFQSFNLRWLFHSLMVFGQKLYFCSSRDVSFRR